MIGGDNVFINMSEVVKVFQEKILIHWKWQFLDDQWKIHIKKLEY